MASLIEAWNNAYSAFVADPAAYRALYQKYMGVAVEPPTPDPHGDWPDRELGALGMVLSRGVIRIGTFLTVPFCYEADGQYTGFEYELANELFRRVGEHYGVVLAVQWVHMDCYVPDNGSDPLDIGGELLQGLSSNRYDFVVAECPSKGPDMPLIKGAIALGSPTAELWVGAMYTGAGNFGIPPVGDCETVADWLRDRVREAPARGEEQTIDVFSSFGGGQTSGVAVLVEAIGADIARSGSMFISEMKTTIELKRRHVYVGDSIQIQYMTQYDGPPWDLGLDLGNLDEGASIPPMGLRPFCLAED